MAKRLFQPRNDFEREFLQLFESLCEMRTAWQVWADLITAIACVIANSVPSVCEEVKEKRKKEYSECIKRLGGVDIPIKIFTVIVKALEDNPWQDFLGVIYTLLNLSDHWKGQFFTPYHVCQFMAEVGLLDVKEVIECDHWASVMDPACGGGAMLIAAAEAAHKKGINYHQDILFVGQDIDRITGMMCYIQLSLLGCPGYIVIGDSLLNPVTGISTIKPTEKAGQEFWYTPMYDFAIWFLRRIPYEPNLCLPSAEKVFDLPQDKKEADHAQPA